MRETLDTVDTCLQGAEELDFCFELHSRGVRARMFEARSLLVPEAVCYFQINRRL